MKKKNLTVLLALLLAAGVASCAALESASAWPASSGAAPYGASDYGHGGSGYGDSAYGGRSDYGDSGHGALATLLATEEIDVLICGGIGGGAINALTQLGIQVVGGAEGSVREAAQAFLDGSLKARSDFRCNHHHHGGEGEEGSGSHNCGNHTNNCGNHTHRCGG